MKIGVLGTGAVGRALAAKLSELGHDVTIGTRDPKATINRSEPDHMGTEPYSAWQARHPRLKLVTFREAAADAAIVVNATSGEHALDALEIAGRLDGKVVLDVSNPLDYSKGMPPTLFVSNTDSLAERIQQAHPQAKVVKSLNTVNASVMVDPKSVGDGDTTIFVSGNDAGAKAEVTRLLRSMGWTDVMDLGDVTTARGTEMWLPLWIRLWGAIGGPGFNLKVVRGEPE